MLRLKRSALGRQLFPKWQSAILRDSFQSWARYLLSQRGDREMFRLKYELVHRELTIHRDFEQQLSETTAGSVSATINNNNTVGTMMKSHRERIVQCTNCNAHYLESQNNSLMCSFHPGVFTVSCPSTCTNPGRTRQCVAHKRRRWSCCGGTDPENPCAKRHHTPAARDPKYEQILRDITERDKHELAALNEKLDHVKKMNWPQQAYALNRSQLMEVEKVVQADRTIVAKFDSLRLSHTLHHKKRQPLKG